MGKYRTDTGKGWQKVNAGLEEVEPWRKDMPLFLREKHLNTIQWKLQQDNKELGPILSSTLTWLEQREKPKIQTMTGMGALFANKMANTHHAAGPVEKYISSKDRAIHRAAFVGANQSLSVSD